MPNPLTFTQTVSDPSKPDVETITFALKNGKLRILMESESRATASAFTLRDGEFSALIDWLVENAAAEGGEPEATG